MQENKSSYKIYSRKRFEIFGKKAHIDNRKNKKFIFLCIMILSVFFTTKIMYQSFEPIFKTLCEDKAHEIATIVTNEESTRVMTNHKYEEMFSIERAQDGSIKMINANIFTINEITSDIALYIQKAIEEHGETEVKLALGSFTGSRLLSSIGPNVKINLSSVGKIKTDVRSEFVSQGINQTLHRVYLQLDCTVNILTPYENIETEVSNQVLLIENMIIGEIPENYFNLEK